MSEGGAALPSQAMTACGILFLKMADIDIHGMQGNGRYFVAYGIIWPDAGLGLAFSRNGQSNFICSRGLQKKESARQ